jgi:hypothetical protein
MRKSKPENNGNLEEFQPLPLILGLLLLAIGTVLLIYVYDRTYVFFFIFFFFGVERTIRSNLPGIMIRKIKKIVKREG